MRPTVFHTFLNLVGVWEDFLTELYVQPLPPPYLHSFSDFTFEELVGGAPLEGKLDSEVPQVKELSLGQGSEEEGQILAYFLIFFVIFWIEYPVLKMYKR